MSEAIKKATMLFVVMIIFIFLAKTFLGEENATVGVSIVLISFMLLGKDLTGNLLKNTIDLVGLIVFICICTYIATFNIYLGLIVNFIGIFVTTYASMSDLKGSVYQPFLLAYVLMLKNVPHHQEIPLRFVGFILGGLFAMLLQYLVNGKKGDKIARASLKSIVELLRKEIKAVRNNESIDKYKENVNKEIKKWNNSILERRDSYFQFTKIEEIQLNFLSILENFELTIEDLGKANSKDKCYDEVLDDLDRFFEILKKSIDEEIDSKEFIKEFNKISKKYEKKSEDDYLLFELFKILERFDYYIEDAMMIHKNEQYRNSVLEVKKPSIWYMIKAAINKNSLRFTFSIRMALMISIVYFITKIVGGSEYTYWIVLTIAMAAVPYNDNIKHTGLNRIYGTILGAVIFFIAFDLISGELLRLAVIMISFYVMNIVKNNIIKNTCTTILALGIYGMSSVNTLGLAEERILFVIIGVIIAVICSMIIFPYDIGKETKVLISRYNRSVKRAIENLKNIEQIEENKIIIKNTLNISRAMEHKILVNNRAINDENISKFIKEQRNIINNLYILINNMEDISKKEFINTKKFNDYIEKFYNNLEEEHEKLIKRIKSQSLSDFPMNYKFTYYNTCKLFSDEKELDKFIKEKNLIL